MAWGAIPKGRHAQPAVQIHELLRLVLLLHDGLDLAAALIPEQQGDGLGDGAIAIHELGGPRRDLAIRPKDVLHAKAGVTDGAVLGQGVHHQPGVGSGRARLGHKERVILSRIGRAELPVARRILGVDIGSDEVEVRGKPLPDIQHPHHGAARRIVAREAKELLALPDVGVHGQRIDGLARLGDVVDIVGDGPGVEELSRVSAVELGPAPRGLRARLLPGGVEGALRGGGDALRQAGGHWAAKDSLSLLAIVTVAPQRARLILHLDGNDRPIGVVLLEIGHQSSKRAGIGIAVGLAIGRETPDGHAQGIDHAPEALLILFYPGGAIVHIAVLPGGEPQEHQLDAVLARQGQQRVHGGQVEDALCRLHLLPVDGYLQGVAVHRRHRPKGGLRLLAIVAARILGLAPQGEEGLAVDLKYPRDLCHGYLAPWSGDDIKLTPFGRRCQHVALAKAKRPK